MAWDPAGRVGAGSSDGGPGGSDAETLDDGDRLTLSRRALLGSSASAAVAVYLARFTHTPVARYLDGVAARLATDGELERRDPRQDNGVIVMSVERPSDLLQLDFAFYNFELDTTSSPVALVAMESDNEILVQFPPQAIGEAAYPYPPSAFDPPPVLSVLAAPSQLVFTVPKGTTIPFTTMTVDDLLDWSGWTLIVPPVAVIEPPHIGITVIPPPLPTSPFGQTLIECPYGLYLSPVVNKVVTKNGFLTTSHATTFTSTVQPTSTDEVTELWTATLDYLEVTTLPVTDDDVSDAEPPHDLPHPVIETVRPLEPLVSAVWSRDLQIRTNKTGDFNWTTWNKLDDPSYYATPFDKSTGLAQLIHIPEDE